MIQDAVSGCSCIARSFCLRGAGLGGVESTREVQEHDSHSASLVPALGGVAGRQTAVGSRK